MDSKKASKFNERLPYSVYYWTVFLITLVGLIDALYLSFSHYRVHMDVGYMSFCAISKALNCDTVSQSKYAVFLDVPLAVWGVIGYLFTLLLLLMARKQLPPGQRIWPSLFVISMLFSVISILLAIISTVFVNSYCLMCILSFGVNFSLFYFVWLVIRRFGTSGMLQSLIQEVQFWKNNAMAGLLIVFVIFTLIFTVIAFYPEYWKHSTVMNAEMNRGVTEDGHPWIGALSPEYTITEFTDYQCFQCKKMHTFLRLIVAQNPTRIRLVHRHFPMDHTINPLVKEPYHVGSGKMALVAIYATEKGKFWEMNDMLFKVARNKDTISIKEISKEIGLDLSGLSEPKVSKDIYDRLVADINHGISLGLEGTPGFQINKKVFSGNIPPDIISTITR